MQFRLLGTRYFPPFLRRLSCLPKDVSGPMPAGYQPAEVEAGWYSWWEENKYFEQSKFTADRQQQPAECFSMVLPPPNITGTLHLGHALTCAIQDSLVRWNRMRKKTTVWFPGCDHAGIATQVIVEKKLKVEGITRHDLGRERFVQEIWKWKHEKEETIYQQLKTLGSTLQWDKAVFTMDPNMSRAVNEAFIRLFDSGKIYRKESLVNWSCQLQSAISDIEVDHQTLDGPTYLKIPGYNNPVKFGLMYQFAYKLSDNDCEEIVVSTTRPETMIGDTAIAVHPDDLRYGRYVGRFAYHPIRQENIPIIADAKVDPQFGTGALKITPAHDLNDYNMAEEHGLKMLNIFDDQGRANEMCGIFAGLPRFELREKMIEYLKERNLLKGANKHAMNVPICSRSRDVIEPLLRPQWFVNAHEMAAKAVEAVEKGQLRILPSHFEGVWFDWLRNIRDWCISRQLWWGHRIPAYFCRYSDGSTSWVVAHDRQEALQKANQVGLTTLVSVEQEDDALDTWFSSALFPFAVCGWPNETADLQKLYPLSLMETGHDILFFWVARMVMLGVELTGQLPFKQIILHGIVCDGQGRKMSKSLGNVIDPEDVINGASLQELEKQLENSRSTGHLSVEEFQKAVEEKRKRFPEGIPPIGADALRFTLCSYNVKNHFINLDMVTMKRNRLFCNKIWQSTRFLFLLLNRCADSLSGQSLDQLTKRPVDDLPLINRWILSQLHLMVQKVGFGLTNYDFHQATDALYHFIYSQLCDIYLEAIKPMSGSEQQTSALILAQCLDVSMRCMAPFMPYLSEEIYQRLHSQLGCRRIDSQRWQSIHIADFPQKEEWERWKDEQLDKNFDLVMEIVAAIRAIKLQYGITKARPETVLVCSIESISASSDHYASIITTLAGLSRVDICDRWTESNPVDGAKWLSRTVGNCSVYLNLAGHFNEELEVIKCRDKINKLAVNLAKLENTTKADNYKTSAPAHVQEIHRKKMADLKDEINRLDNYWKGLKGPTSAE